MQLIFFYQSSPVPVADITMDLKSLIELHCQLGTMIAELEKEEVDDDDDG